MPRTTHKDLEFQINDSSCRSTFDTYEEAVKAAVSISIRTGHAVNVDVLAWSIVAARAWNGSEGCDVYKEDPDASVHERIVIKAESLGRVA